MQTVERFKNKFLKQVVLPRANRSFGASDRNRPGQMGKLSKSRAGRKKLHDLLIALAFIGMVIAPAIVANYSRVEIGDDSK